MRIGTACTKATFEVGVSRYWKDRLGRFSSNLELNDEASVAAATFFLLHAARSLPLDVGGLGLIFANWC